MNTATPASSTMRSMNALELNRIAVWQPKLIDELTVREAGAGRAHLQDGIISKTTAKTYRFAKNYQKGETKFCLFVVSYRKDAKAVEKELDKIAKKITEATAKKVVLESNATTFQYTDYFLEEK